MSSASNLRTKHLRTKHLRTKHSNLFNLNLISPGRNVAAASQLDKYIDWVTMARGHVVSLRPESSPKAAEHTFWISTGLERLITLAKIRLNYNKDDQFWRTEWQKELDLLEEELKNLWDAWFNYLVGQ